MRIGWEFDVLKGRQNLRSKDDDSCILACQYRILICKLSMTKVQLHQSTYRVKTFTLFNSWMIFIYYYKLIHHFN
jgi:hypothetical protein